MIPLQDFKRHVEAFRAVVKPRLLAVHDRAHFILGPEVAEFEERFAGYLGVRHCIAVANGTQAMEVSLRALDAAGGEVVTSANAGMYATCAILAAGIRPVLCEIDPVLMTMDPDALQKAITPRTRAVIVTHLYGQAADMGRIADICREAGVALIEDCAESHGARWEGKRTGSFGLAGCFSFYPTKNLGAYGDAGAIATDSDAFAEKARSLRQYGWSQKYVAQAARGTNSRMDEMQAAVLNAKLGSLDAMNERRRRIVSHYNETLGGKVPHLPFAANDNFVVHHYVLRSERRERVREALAARGVGTDIHFPVPDHLQPGLAEIFAGVSLPHTESACATVFTVPSFPEMTDDEVSRVAGALADCYMP